MMRLARPGRLIVHLGMLMCRKLVGNARGLLRVVHRIGSEGRHCEKNRRKDERRSGRGRKGEVVFVVKDSEQMVESSEEESSRRKRPLTQQPPTFGSCPRISANQIAI